MIFSFFKSGITQTKPDKSVDLSFVFERIKNGFERNRVDLIRSENDKKKQNTIKEKLPYVTFSGVFSPPRSVSTIEKYSGLIQLDIDNLPESVHLETVKKDISKEPWVSMIFVSPRGNGLKIIAKVSGAKTDHKRNFLALGEHIKKQYGYEIDKAVSSVASACFLSYDPQIYYNPNATDFVPPVSGVIEVIELPHKKAAAPPPVSATVQSAFDELETIERLVSRAVNSGKFPNLEYDQWQLLAFSFASLGEPARALFHTISQLSKKYDCDYTNVKFTDALKNGRLSRPSLFVKICKDNGIDVRKYDQKDQTKPPKNTEKTVSGMVSDKISTPVTLSAARQMAAANRFDSDVIFDYETLSMRVREGKSWVQVSDGFLMFMRYICQNEKEELTYIFEVKRFQNWSDGDVISVYMSIKLENFMGCEKLKTELFRKRFSLCIKPVNMDVFRTFLLKNTNVVETVKVSRFGYNKLSDSYIFSNCAIKGKEVYYPDNFNMVDIDGVTICLPDVDNTKREPFTFIKNEKLTFNYFYTELITAYSESEVQLAVFFFVSSFFRDIAIEVTAASPLLFFNGPAGTGKTTILRLLTCLFGYQQKEVNLKALNTQPAVQDSMTTLSNAVMLFDEYKPGQNTDAPFQSSYDDQSRLKKDLSNYEKNQQLPVLGSIALVSNYMPKEEWFFMRCIYQYIGRRERTDARTNAFRKIKEICFNGASQIAFEILQHRHTIKLHFKEAYMEFQNRLSVALKKNDVPDRLINNMAQTLTVPYILHSTCNVFMIESAPIECMEEFVEIGAKNIMVQYRIMSDNSLLSDFFNIVQQMYENKMIIEGVHFKFTKQKTEIEVKFNFSTLFKKYEKEYPKFNGGVSAPDKKMILSDLVSFCGKTDEKELYTVDRFRKETDNPDSKGSGRDCIAISYEKLQENYQLDLKLMNG